MIHLKNLLTIICLILMFFGLNAQTGIRKIAITKNYLANTNWRIDGTPFETESREKYSLTEMEVESNWHWGNFIKFEESTFSSWYSAPCGNDCFTSVYGEYNFVDAYVLEIKVNKIDRGGFCSQKSEEVNKNYGQFKIEKTEQGWIMNKILK